MQVSSRLVWYILIFVVLACVIGGIVFYTFKIRKSMRNRDIDDNPESIIGSNPEPSRKGKYGRN